MYIANEERYNGMKYNRCGKSGIMLPAISLGLWHNFGDAASFENCSDMIKCAFDLGITHFDIANNYGPPPGSAEENFGKILKQNFLSYRDEMLISTKAGYYMWQGPYGEWGSKKYLFSSLDQSLKRLQLDYVDIFYHHRPDPNTPLEETMAALDLIAKQGKALYVGISNYNAEDAKKAIDILKALGTPCLIHQPKYSMLERTPENGLLDVLQDAGVGSIAFSPLGGGRLTNRYLHGIPEDSRAAGASPFLKPTDINESLLDKLNKLKIIAENRDQSLAQLALAWVLRDGKITSALIGASNTAQIIECAATISNLTFSIEELALIDDILVS